MRFPGFRISSPKGFHVTFENGYTVSVQFGPGNYCQHYDRSIRHDDAACGKEGSYDAETAVWAKDGDLIRLPEPFYTGDTVQPRQSPADVLALMNWAAAQPASDGGK